MDSPEDIFWCHWDRPASTAVSGESTGQSIPPLLSTRRFAQLQPGLARLEPLPSQNLTHSATVVRHHGCHVDLRPPAAGGGAPPTARPDAGGAALASVGPRRQLSRGTCLGALSARHVGGRTCAGSESWRGRSHPTRIFLHRPWTRSASFASYGREAAASIRSDG